MAGMRGAADVLLLIGMGIGLFLIFFDFTPVWYEGDVYRVNLHTHMYGMGNALDAAGLYANTSLDYSVYQAVYETLKSGGFGTVPEDGAGFWRDSGRDIEIPGDEDVLSSIEAGIADKFAAYTRSVYSFSSDYQVRFPSFRTSMEQEPGSLRVSASSDTPMSITKLTKEFEMEEDITLKRSLSLEKTYDIDISGILGTAREQNTQIYSSLSDTVKTEVDSWEKQSQEKPDEETLKTKMRDALGSVPVLSEERVFGDYVLRPSVHDILALRTSMENPDGSFSHQYDVAVTLKIEVVHRTEKYPVYDSRSGKITIESPGLVFLDRFSYKTPSG